MSLASFGRFSEPAFNILVALADGPKHGYAMTQDIEAMTGSRPGPGTLYGAIARLEERGWIEPRIDALRAVTKIAQTRPPAGSDAWHGVMILVQFATFVAVARYGVGVISRPACCE